MNEIRGFSGIKSETSNGVVLQVVHTMITDAQDISTSTWQPVVGLSAGIRLRDNSSKVLICVSLVGSCNGQAHAKITRNGSDLTLGDDSGDTKIEAQFGAFNTASSNAVDTCSFMYYDSPKNTNLQTYSVYVYHSSGDIGINRSRTDSNSTGAGRYVSTITLSEIAG